MGRDTTATAASGESGEDQALLEATYDRFRALITKIDHANPDREALAEFRAVLNDYPGLCNLLGDVAKYARDELPDRIAGDQRSIKISIEQKIRELSDDLDYQTSPALEKLLIENVVLCWVHYTDTMRRYVTVTAEESLTITQADRWDRRLDRAHGRYLRACDELARVRKMLRPMQVNIGMNQINVAK